MPRQGRLHIPGGYYHVIGRGLEQRHIFAEPADKRDFLRRLGKSLGNTDASCLAWAVMSNHYHLLIRAGELPLSRLMASLLTGYAVNYNRRHQRAGYVYQNRFKSVLCDADDYLKTLIAYIHLNPVKAGLVRNIAALDRYPWTSHAGLLGYHLQDWQAITEILELFAHDAQSARRDYRDFMVAQAQPEIAADYSGGGLIRSYEGWHSAGQKKQDHEVRIGDERILGRSDFVRMALSNDSLELEKSHGFAAAGWNLKSLADAVCRQFGVKPDDLAKRGRGNDLSKARQLIAHLAISELQIAPNRVAKLLQVTQSGVSKLNSRGRQLARVEPVCLEQLSK